METPERAYRAASEASPKARIRHFQCRTRIDRLNSPGKASLRRVGKMHHRELREESVRQRILMLIDDTTATERTTGEILSHNIINSDRSLWPNTPTPAGRWSG